MHGCYENVLGNKKMFPTADDDFRRAEKYCDHWVWTAEKNKIVFRNGHINPKATSHIVNGFSPVYDFRLKRSDLNISDESLVFTIASRAIESKGWGASLSAFEILKEKYSADADIHLLMIGDGPESEAIRLQPPISGVHLINHTSRLADFINISDVCLLPSWFPGESLPLVLLEFLAQGKPAIVSDIGMCPWAIGEGTLEPPAGFVVPRGASGRVAYEALASAMEKFIIDPRLRETLRPTALEAFKKFDMDQMIAAYQELSATVVQSDGVLPVSPDKSARSC
jgi:glycosyltransferase involved in cell wall biosynthesis